MLNSRRNPSRRQSLFLINRAFHRDIGYFCVGLILVYAISGITVNHIDSWNPSYIVTREDKLLNDLVESPHSADFEKSLVNALGIQGEFRSRLDAGPDELLFFFEGARVSWTPSMRLAQIEITDRRPGFFFVNYLHLNKAKRAWSYVADAFAVLLIYLAISGLFMVKGRRGFFQRGWILVLLGFLVPVLGFWLYV